MVSGKFYHELFAPQNFERFAWSISDKTQRIKISDSMSLSLEQSSMRHHSMLFSNIASSDSQLRRC